MAPNDERSGVTHQSHDEANPFIAFRRYADEQIANLLHSFIGLPSALSSTNTNPQWRPYDDEARRRARDNWYASAQNDEGKSVRHLETDRDGSTDQVNGSKAYESPLRKLFQRPEEDTKADEAPICPYRPIEQQSPKLLQPAQCLLPWPVNYMLYSSYSPYHLERDENTRPYGSRWRNAFEELLDYEGGDTDSEEGLHSTSRPGCGPLRLYDGGNPVSLPDLTNRLREWATERNLRHAAWFEMLALRQLEHDAMEEEATELDLYERLWNLNGSEGNKVLAPGASVSEATGRDAQRENSQAQENASLGIISTLTSTERVILPDGTVHTKVMLKKRFADGREESSETVHTTQGGTHVHDSNSAEMGAVTKLLEPATSQSDDKSRTPKSEKRGWFWS